jgi:hypothetical protein
MRARLHRFLHERATRILTAPLGSYQRSSGQDIDRLKLHLRKGDVVLVCGDQRVSEVIRYLTQSSWSHSAIYIGDELLRRHPDWTRELEDRFGDDARHLIIEALVGEGVVVSPISKYRGFHIRLCRPFGLEADDVVTLMDEVIGQLGGEYDVANLLDLGRYFLPVSLVPARFRRDALELGSGRPTEVICSSMIARAFDAVGFPILPRTDEELQAIAETRHAPVARRAGAMTNGHARPRRHYHIGDEAPTWPSRRPLARHLRMPRRPFSLVTPRDFDLSPYFEIVKFSLIEGTRTGTEAIQPERTARPGMARRAVAALPLFGRLRRRPAVADATGLPRQATGT